MAYRAPRSPTERQLVEILQEILAIEQVGIDDNFFDLGANSVLLLQVHQRLQEELGREIQGVEIFNHPTVAALAVYLGQVEEGTADRPVEVRQEQLKSGRDRLRQRRARRRRSS